MEHKILIVEDDDFLSGLVTRKLVAAGFTVSSASDGEEAMRKIKEEKPGLILLDEILPGINGFEILTHIKKDPATATIPVIMLTNMGQKEEIDRGLALGASEYLIKAYLSPDEIVKKVKTYIPESNRSARNTPGV
ncbi:MAG: response regulator [bacterium]|nr:response regulator [bacterium]